MTHKPEAPSMKRSGPHPVAFHATNSTQNWAGAAASLPLFLHNNQPIHPEIKPRANALLLDMKNLDPVKLHLAVMTRAQQRLADMFAGIRAYQDHPYQRAVAPMPLFTRTGTTEVRNYGGNFSDNAPIVLAVPSLINPAYILDLREDHSLMRTLADQGIHGLLLDWTTPGKEELAFGLEDYVLKRLIPLIRRIHHQYHRKIHLLGYCMGGNLSLAAALILQGENIIDSLTLIATPWDFHAAQPAHLSLLTAHFIAMKDFIADNNAVPMNIMQMFFFSLDPTLSDRKFRKFCHLDPKSPEARNFVAIEDWANDGAPLASKVTRDCLINWYQHNQPEKNCWTIGGIPIDPTRLALPGHIITPTSDRIVPPHSALALVRKLPHFTHSSFNGGHVSLIAGEKANTTLWPKITSYLSRIMTH